MYADFLNAARCKTLALLLLTAALLLLTPGAGANRAEAKTLASVSSPAQPAVLAQLDKAKPRQDDVAAAGDSLETRFWNNIKNSDAVEDFRIYLDAYPDGRFAAQARARMQELLAKSPGAPAKPPAAAPPVVAPPAAKATAPAAKPQPTSTVRDCPECPELALIPAGSFNMGSTEMFPFEAPVHPVTIRDAFYLGQREVTLAEWGACVADGGCAYSPPGQSATRDQTPVTNLDWNDAHQYANWLRKKTGKAYRLPSESEWEYAARAGGTTTYIWGPKLEMNMANCAGCNEPKNTGPVPTGSYPPNAFGLYDMAGNVAEWVEDCWHDSYKSAPADGSAWGKPQCQERVLRGGSFNNDPRYVRSASRFKYDFDVRYYTNGFRVARDR
jgi:formylglycine-generating enzyme required for sulfatase activity